VKGTTVVATTVAMVVVVVMGATAVLQTNLKSSLRSRTMLTRILTQVKQTQELSQGLLRTAMHLALVLVVLQLLVWQLRQDQPLVALSQMLRVAKEAMVVTHTPMAVTPMPEVEMQTAEHTVKAAMQGLRLEMLPLVQVTAERLPLEGSPQ
jgi:hypothetical protein